MGFENKIDLSKGRVLIFFTTSEIHLRIAIFIANRYANSANFILRNLNHPFRNGKTYSSVKVLQIILGTPKSIQILTNITVKYNADLTLLLK